MICVGIASVLLIFFISIVIKPVPSFNDPLVGFEARGTTIAARLNTWKLLADETTASVNKLSLSANSDNYEISHTPSWSLYNNELDSTGDDEDRQEEPPIVEMSTHFNESIDSLDRDEKEFYLSINSAEHTYNKIVRHSLKSNEAFCGRVYEGYVQVVVSASSKNSLNGLFNLNSILAICQIDRKLRLEDSLPEHSAFEADCERAQIGDNSTSVGIDKTNCCNSWSLPNYIAHLTNKTTCSRLEQRDLKVFERLLTFCAPYYHRAPHEECFIGNDHIETYNPHSNELNTNTSQAHTGSKINLKTHCGTIPRECTRSHGWIYNLMTYLVNENFVRNRNLHGASDRAFLGKLTYTNIFLPIAKSSNLMNYYQAISRHNLRTPYAQVKAMDLGLKNSLFERLIFEDIRLFLAALMSIMIVISIYTWSTILSFVIFAIISMSLCLSYAIYTLLLDIAIFPFMNLLAIVISFGICSDNAMLFCKNWANRDEETICESSQSSPDCRNQSQTVKTGDIDKASMDRILKRAIVSTSVATLATACSFIMSAISRVVAVRCFCIYATLCVLTNYLLTVILLPPALIIDAKLSRCIETKIKDIGPRHEEFVKRMRLVRETIVSFDCSLHTKWIFWIVTQYKSYLIISFIALLACSSILVLHKPQLHPSDEEATQLLTRGHPFEQYDKHLRKQFAFERAKMGDLGGKAREIWDYDTLDTMPVRVVFGLQAADTGDHFEPYDRGTLQFDAKFDITDPHAQIWLLDFCQKLRNQRFIHPSASPDLTNCFMTTFKSWMDNRSCQDPIRPELNRSPCCQAYEFPYTRSTFNKCVGEAVSIMSRTPQFYSNMGAGVRFFKNSTKVAALVIVYPSNRFYSESFSRMDRFYQEVDDWVTWQINNTAPQSLKSGWFISDNLEIFALQTELLTSTASSILLEVLLAMVFILVGTRDIILTITGTLTIGTIIMVTVAMLILLHWTLGVAESILISLTIGLSVDFALHYTVAYSQARYSFVNMGIMFGILSEVGSPIALATITTTLAGFMIIWSDILAYQELGVFLILIASISWLTSSFFLLPMLATISSLADLGRVYLQNMLQRLISFIRFKA